MGLILIPAEIRTNIEKIRSFLSENEEAYNNALQVVEMFTQNDELDTEAWSALKNKLTEYHQAIVPGMVIAQECVSNDLDV